MSNKTPDTDWIRAVLRHNLTTRHLHVEVVSDEESISLEGRVPTRADRDRAGFVARKAATPGIPLINNLRAQDDLAGIGQIHLPSMRAMNRVSVAALAA